MKTSTKFLIGIPAVLAVIIVIAAVVAILLFPKERVIALAEQTASNALGMTVTVDDAGISFAGIPALKISGITVGPPAWANEPIATIDAIRVRVNLMKLLSRQVEIVSADIDRPVIVFAPPPADTTSAQPADAAESPAGPPSLPFPVTMRSLGIHDGRIMLALADSGSITLDKINQELSVSLDRALTRLETSGTLSVSDITFASAMLPEPVTGIALTFTHKASGDLTTGSFTLTSGAVTVNGLPIELSGSMTEWTDIAFSLSTGEMNAAGVLALIPGSLLPARDDITAEGTFSLALSGSLDQSASDDALRYSGTFDIPGMRLAYRGAPAGVDNIAASIAFDESRIDIGRIAIATGSSELTIGGAITSYTTEPAADLSIGGAIVMDDLTAAVPALAGKNLRGAIGIDLAVTGGMDPSSIKPRGSLTLDGFTLELPGVLNHPLDLTGRIGITPESLAIENLAAASGASDFRFEGSLANYLRLLDPAADQPASFTSTLSSDLIDIADLIVIDETKKNQVIMPWDLKEPIESMPVPPNLTARTAIRLGTVRFGSLTADSVSGDIVLDGGKLDLTGLAVNAYEGTLTGSFGADFSDVTEPTYQTALTLAGFEAGTFLADLFGTGRFMRGTLSSTIALSGAGLDSVEVLDNLTGAGGMRFADGEIDNWEFTRKLGEHLAFLDFDTLAFDTIVNTFRIEDQHVITPDMHLTFSHGDIYLDGTTGFDTSIDYRMRLVLDRETSGRAIRSLNSLANLLDAGVDSIELDVTATGSLADPAFRLDTSKAEQRLRDEARDKVQEKAGEILDNVIDDPDIREQGQRILEQFLR